MKIFYYISIMLICLYLTDTSFAITANEILKKVSSRKKISRVKSEIEMTLIDSSGNFQKKKFTSFGLNKRDVNLAIIFFTYPKKIKNTAYLTYNYNNDDKSTQQWVYLPSIKKTKRIGVKDNNKSFMGSDFSYSDLKNFNIKSYDFKISKESIIKNKPVWLIYAYPKTTNEILKSGYSKSLFFITKEDFMLIRSVNWVYKKNIYKIMDVKKIKKINDILIATEIHVNSMIGKKLKHKTIFKINNIILNDNAINEQFFTIKSLERGI